MLRLKLIHVSKCGPSRTNLRRTSSSNYIRERIIVCSYWSMPQSQIHFVNKGVCNKNVTWFIGYTLMTKMCSFLQKRYFLHIQFCVNSKHGNLANVIFWYVFQETVNCILSWSIALVSTLCDTVSPKWHLWYSIMGDNNSKKMSNLATGIVKRTICSYDKVKVKSLFWVQIQAQSSALQTLTSTFPGHDALVCIQVHSNSFQGT